jgi:hypothetical protein
MFITFVTILLGLAFTFTLRKSELERWNREPNSARSNCFYKKKNIFFYLTITLIENNKRKEII